MMSITVVPTMKQAITRLGLTPEKQKAVNDRSLRTITAFILREMQKSFTESGQGQPGGEGWKDLDPAYLADKISEGYSALIGVRETFLKRTLRSDLNLAQGKSDTGSPEPHAPFFQALRSFLPVEEYVLNHWQDVHVGIWKRGTVGSFGG
jgi:hypothetical protein